MQLFWMLVNRGMLYEKMCLQLPGCSGYICIDICLVGYGTYNNLIMMIPDKVKNKKPREKLVISMKV